MSERPNQFLGLPIFEDPGARTTDPDTSHLAAERAKESAPAQRKRIVEALRTHGPQTADGLDELICWRPTTAGRRLGELRTAEVVEMTAYKAMTRSGRQARIWKLRNPR